MLGPAWTRGGRPAVGHWTKGLAEAELRRILTEAQRGTLPGMVRTGVTFEQAAAEWLRYAENERDVKPSTLGDYRMMVRVLNRSLGHLRLEDITIETLERWREGYIAEGSASTAPCRSTRSRSARSSSAQCASTACPTTPPR